MDALIEIIFEIVFELFGEIIIEIGGALLSNFADYIHANSKAKKILKYSISGIFFYGCLVLLILSLVYKKALYVEIVIIYFIVLLITYILRFLNKNILKSQGFGTVITWATRIIHYIFPVVLIIVAATNKNKATPVIISLSSVALFVYFCINFYRFIYSSRLKNFPFFKAKMSKIILKHREKKTAFSRRKLEKIILRNIEFSLRFIQECEEKEFSAFLDLLEQKEFILQLGKRYDIEQYFSTLEKEAERFYFIDIENKIESARRKIQNKKENL